MYFTLSTDGVVYGRVLLLLRYSCLRTEYRFLNACTNDRVGKKKLDKILRISCVVYILYRAIVHHKSITHRSNSWLTHIHMTCIYNSVWYSILDDSKCMDRVVHLFNSKRFSFIATVRTFQKIGFSNKRVEHFYYNACMHVC